MPHNLRREPHVYEVKHKRKQNPARLPWEADMTLCLAAICVARIPSNDYRIVFGADRRAEASWVGGDVAFKFDWIAKGWAALIAGDTSKSLDFLSTTRAAFEADPTPVSRNNVFDRFNDISCAHKEKLCHRFIRQQLGISFDQFMNQSEDDLPSDLRGRLFHEMGQLEYGCELLVFGFTKRELHSGDTIFEPKIVEIDRYGEVFMHQNFAAIGTGAVIAKSTLYQRGQSAFTSLESTIYRIFEASHLAYKSAPGVGQITQFQILEPPTVTDDTLRLKGTNQKCLGIMASTFEAIGPKPMIAIPSLSNCFDVILPLRPKRKAKSPKKTKAKDS